MGSEQRKRLLVIAAAVCLGLLAGDRFVVSPLSSLWARQSEEIASYTQSLEKGELLIDRAEALEQRRAEMVERSLPKDPADAENRILTAVGEWANRSRVQIEALKPRWVSDKKLGDRLEVRLSAKGNIRSVSRFLYELETDENPIRLEDVEITSSDNRGQELGLDVRFSGMVLEAAQ